MLEWFLTMTDVQVVRHVKTAKGNGGFTTATATTTLSKAIIYQNSGRRSMFSDRINLTSTYELVTMPSYYAWNRNDQLVIHGGDTFDITVHPDNVMGLGEIMVVGLELTK